MTSTGITVAAIIIALLYWVTAVTLFALTISSLVYGNYRGAFLYGLFLVIWFAIWWVDWWIFLLVAIGFLVFHYVFEWGKPIEASKKTKSSPAKKSGMRGKKGFRRPNKYSFRIKRR